jgi:catechol 2,3-dioxygenase-like lactoylglutathione lyase family enzyme
MAVPDLLGIVVKDMTAALRFYRLLGLEIPAGADEESHVEITLAGGFRVAWDTLELMKSIHPDWVEPAGHRNVLAFKCENPAEVDALYQQVVSAGYRDHTAPWDAFWGQRYAVVLDPDGNLVDLFAGLA